jgi:hypothetical protein
MAQNIPDGQMGCVNYSMMNDISGGNEAERPWTSLALLLLFQKQFKSRRVLHKNTTDNWYTSLLL